MSARESEAPASAAGQMVGGRLRAVAGETLSRFGLTCLPLAFGAILGYYASDQGVRWLPNMLSIVLGFLIAGFIAIPIGRLVEGRARDETTRERRLRRRVLAFLLLASIAASVRLALHVVEGPSPLTSMARSDFDRAFEIDADRFRALDHGLEQSVAFLEAHPAFGTRAGAVLAADDEREVLDAWTAVYEQAFVLDALRVYYEDWFRFDPSRVERSYHLRSYLLTYAAECALYEKSARLVRLFARNENAVKFLDAPHPDKGLPDGSFGLLKKELQGSRDQARVVAGKRYLKYVLDGVLGGRDDARALGCHWLWRRVESLLATIHAFGALDRTLRMIAADLDPLRRKVRRVFYPAQSKVAGWLGDTKLRRVGRYLIGPDMLGPMDERLEPGDVLLSRKNWYLSNVGLPGFWPHAILYIGDPQKLDAYFAADEVRAWVRAETKGAASTLRELLEVRARVEWGRYLAGEGGEQLRVIEAVSEGVILNTLQHAAGDYLAALRPRLDRVAKAKAVLDAFSHLGKPYDFDFDFATANTLVCTELVWRSYRPAGDKPGLDIALCEIMGRKTLPANEIARVFAAERGLPDRRFDFVYFIDANEDRRRAFVAGEDAFARTHARTKWDVALD